MDTSLIKFGCYILTVPRTKIMMLFYLRGLAEDIMNTLHVEFWRTVIIIDTVLLLFHIVKLRITKSGNLYSNIPRYPSKEIGQR